MRGTMQAEVLYEMLSNLSGRRFVKYVLDKNNTDNTLFCVDSKIIKHTTNVTTIDKIIRPFIFKSMYKGLFDDFDYQRNKVDTRKNNSNNNNNNNSNTNNATLSDAKIAAKKLLNCCHKDHTEYSMRKEDQETMVLTEIGVKHNAMLNRNVGPSRTQKPAYGLYISHTDRDKVVNVPVRFQNDTNSSIDNNSGEGGKKESKGLTLFLRTIIQLGTDDLRTLQMVALRSIDNIFSLRCDRFPTMYADAAIDTFVSLSQVRFVKALYDLKRAGDYLPVKATRNANIAFAHHDTIYFYVSSDRLAVAYALLQGCPCIHVVNGGNDFKIYNPRGQVMVGGRGSISSGKKTVARRPPTTTNRRNEEEMLSYDLYMRMRLDDLVPESPSSEFEAFLVRYRHAFDETYMTYFWYVVYRFLFFLQFPA